MPPVVFRRLTKKVFNRTCSARDGLTAELAEATSMASLALVQTVVAELVSVHVKVLAMVAKATASHCLPWWSWRPGKWPRQQRQQLYQQRQV